MSCLICGMEMPKDGDWVNVNICSDGSVYFIKSASNGFVFYGVRKGEAIEIPPHGRLGDLDELESGLRHMAKYQHGERQQGILGCCETIRLTPTIIPANKPKQTNADRIRSMTDEELAEFLTGCELDTETWLDWLKAEGGE